MDNKVKSVFKRIDIKKVFYEKNPKVARLIPGFIFRYLKKIIHEDFINDFQSRHGNKMNLDYVDAAIEEFNVSIKVIGEENIPREGKYIFVANHPLGGFDGIVIMKVMSKHFKSFKYLVNDILMNITNLGGIFLPINKHGKQATDLVKTIDTTYMSDNQILTFPAGLVSRRIKGQIVDLKWHKNFIAKAKQYQRDVVPIHISGRNTDFFYRLGAFRKFLGIKANIEMLYLADETYKHRNKHITVKFGKPIAWKTFDKSRKPVEWAKWVKEKVYALDGIMKIPL